MVAYSIEFSSIYDIKKQKGQLQFIFASSKCKKKTLKSQTLQEANLPQLDTVVYKWFIAERS
jgi:hypothetical protein